LSSLTDTNPRVSLNVHESPNVGFQTGEAVMTMATLPKDLLRFVKD